MGAKVKETNLNNEFVLINNNLILLFFTFFNWFIRQDAKQREATFVSDVIDNS